MSDRKERLVTPRRTSSWKTEAETVLVMAPAHNSIPSLRLLSLRRSWEVSSGTADIGKYGPVDPHQDARFGRMKGSGIVPPPPSEVPQPVSSRHSTGSECVIISKRKFGIYIVPCTSASADLWIIVLSKALSVILDIAYSVDQIQSS